VEDVACGGHAGRVHCQHDRPAMTRAHRDRGLAGRGQVHMFDIILDEAVLRRVVGSHAVMARQLRTLLEAADRPNVRLWVVPAETSGLVGFDSSFYMLNFPRDETVIQMETKASSVYLEDKGKIDIFRRHAAKLGKAALDPARSVDFVAAIAREHERE
jgi:hypothetical protein